jgi:hypothetical protein
VRDRQDDDLVGFYLVRDVIGKSPYEAATNISSRSNGFDSSKPFGRPQDALNRFVVLFKELFAKAALLGLIPFSCLTDVVERSDV